MLWAKCVCLLPTKSYVVEAQTPSVMVFGDGAFGRFLSLHESGAHESGALMLGLVLLLKVTAENLLLLSSAREDVGRRCSSASQEESFHQNLTLPAPQSWASRLQSCGE